MDWLLWIDLETTGLDPSDCHILQVGCILSTMKAEVCYELPQLILYCDKSVIENMDEWCKKTHTRSGLVEHVLISNMTVEQAEQQICMHLNNYVRVQDKVYLAGNSVHFDRSFIQRWMPRLAQRLSHRIVDVSSFALVCKNLNPRVYEFRPVKSHVHTALVDIRESIREYQYYLTTFTQNNPQEPFDSPTTYNV